MYLYPNSFLLEIHPRRWSITIELQYNKQMVIKKMWSSKHHLLVGLVSEHYHISVRTHFLEFSSLTNPPNFGNCRFDHYWAYISLHPCLTKLRPPLLYFSSSDISSPTSIFKASSSSLNFSHLSSISFIFHPSLRESPLILPSPPLFSKPLVPLYHYHSPTTPPPSSNSVRIFMDPTLHLILPQERRKERRLPH